MNNDDDDGDDCNSRKSVKLSSNVFEFYLIKKQIN